jgi:hypothetical protein
MNKKVGKLSGAAERKENAQEAETTKELNQQEASLTAPSSTR